MLCVEDYLDALEWADSIGGLQALMKRADANAAIIADWVARTNWVDFLCTDPALRSNTSVCLKIVDPQILALPNEEQAALVKKVVEILDSEDAAKDIGSYRDAPPGLRIWAGSTVDSDDLVALMPWLDWAFVQAARSLNQTV